MVEERKDFWDDEEDDDYEQEREKNNENYEENDDEDDDKEDSEDKEDSDGEGGTVGEGKAEMEDEYDSEEIELEDGVVVAQKRRRENDSLEENMEGEGCGNESKTYKRRKIAFSDCDSEERFITPRFPSYVLKYSENKPIIILGFLKKLASRRDGSWQSVDAGNAIMLLRGNPTNRHILDAM